MQYNQTPKVYIEIYLTKAWNLYLIFIKNLNKVRIYRHANIRSIKNPWKLHIIPFPKNFLRNSALLSLLWHRVPFRIPGGLSVLSSALSNLPSVLSLLPSPRLERPLGNLGRTRARKLDDLRHDRRPRTQRQQRGKQARRMVPQVCRWWGHGVGYLYPVGSQGWTVLCPEER